MNGYSYCKYGHHYSDWVPIPFGSGDCEMPGFECTYDGDGKVPDTCDETLETCSCFEPSEKSLEPHGEIDF